VNLIIQLVYDILQHTYQTKFLLLILLIIIIIKECRLEIYKIVKTITSQLLVNIWEFKTLNQIKEAAL